MLPWQKQKPELRITTYDNYKKLRGPFDLSQTTSTRKTDYIYKGTDREINKTLQDFQSREQYQSIKKQASYDKLLSSSKKDQNLEWTTPAALGVSLIASFLTGDFCDYG
jgi:hypothetical protein